MLHCRVSQVVATDECKTLQPERLDKHVFYDSAALKLLWNVGGEICFRFISLLFPNQLFLPSNVYDDHCYLGWAM
jgi:hypothetical protein